VFERSIRLRVTEAKNSCFCSTQTNVVSAVDIAERIRTSMQETIKLEGKSVTASSGVIEIEENKSIQELIKFAERAPYEHQGRMVKNR